MPPGPIGRGPGLCPRGGAGAASLPTMVSCARPRRSWGLAFALPFWRWWRTRRRRGGGGWARSALKERGPGPLAPGHALLFGGRPPVSPSRPSRAPYGTAGSPMGDRSPRPGRCPWAGGRRRRSRARALALEQARCRDPPGSGRVGCAHPPPPPRSRAFAEGRSIDQRRIPTCRASGGGRRKKDPPPSMRYKNENCH